MAQYVVPVLSIVLPVVLAAVAWFALMAVEELRMRPTPAPPIRRSPTMSDAARQEQQWQEQRIQRLRDDAAKRAYEAQDRSGLHVWANRDEYGMLWWRLHDGAGDVRMGGTLYERWSDVMRDGEEAVARERARRELIAMGQEGAAELVGER